MEAACIANCSLNAFTFFNCGFNSGASILHRHLQVMPYESIGGDGETTFAPVEDAALQAYMALGDKQEVLFRLPQFNFDHVFHRLDPIMWNKMAQSPQDMAEGSKIVHDAYLSCLAHLGINMSEMTDIKEDNVNDHNMLLMKNFLIVVPRSAEGYKEDEASVTVNSLGFVGTLAVKAEADLDLI